MKAQRLDSTYRSGKATTVDRSSVQRLIQCLTVLLAIQLAGCEPTPDDFQPNLVFMRNQKLVETIQDFELPEVQQQVSDIADAAELLFGTPDAPRIPDLEPFAGLIDSDLLKMAAGLPAEGAPGRQRGLYRQYCAACHGVTGHGQGPDAASLDPYPRDYRRGIFKFKSTPLIVPPTRDDLRAVLWRGVPGTDMPSFENLPADQIDALVEYVRYLSMRGMFERLVISELAWEFDPGDRLIDISLRDDAPRTFEAQQDFLLSLAQSVAEPWASAAQNVSEVPARPDHWGSDDSIAYGRQLFFLSITNCAECHGNLALGDGITDDYDEWTKELDPENFEVVQEYLDLGALPPRPTRPRNLREGIYRGGAAPETQFLRVRNGIAGTTMPSISTQLGDDEIWHLVAYVRSLHAAISETEMVPAPIQAAVRQ